MASNSNCVLPYAKQAAPAANALTVNKFECSFMLSPYLQTFLDALIDPSLQTNLPLLQWETPPFLPLHGVFLAIAGVDDKTNTVANTLKTDKNLFIIAPFDWLSFYYKQSYTNLAITLN